eukprot:2549974-Karenia_brevis.AAC.1
MPVESKLTADIKPAPPYISTQGVQKHCQLDFGKEPVETPAYPNFVVTWTCHRHHHHHQHCDHHLLEHHDQH